MRSTLDTFVQQVYVLHVICWQRSKSLRGIGDSARISLVTFFMHPMHMGFSIEDIRYSVLDVLQHDTFCDISCQIMLSIAYQLSVSTICYNNNHFLADKRKDFIIR